jgi:hypothetical protein
MQLILVHLVIVLFNKRSVDWFLAHWTKILRSVDRFLNPFTKVN